MDITRHIINKIEKRVILILNRVVMTILLIGGLAMLLCGLAYETPQVIILGATLLGVLALHTILFRKKWRSLEESKHVKKGTK